MMTAYSLCIFYIANVSNPPAPVCVELYNDHSPGDVLLAPDIVVPMLNR